MAGGEETDPRKDKAVLGDGNEVLDEEGNPVEPIDRPRNERLADDDTVGIVPRVTPSFIEMERQTEIFMNALKLEMKESEQRHLEEISLLRNEMSELKEHFSKEKKRADAKDVRKTQKRLSFAEETVKQLEDHAPRQTASAAQPDPPDESVTLHERSMVLDTALEEFYIVEWPFDSFVGNTKGLKDTLSHEGETSFARQVGDLRYRGPGIDSKKKGVLKLSELMRILVQLSQDHALSPKGLIRLLIRSMGPEYRPNLRSQENLQMPLRDIWVQLQVSCGDFTTPYEGHVQIQSVLNNATGMDISTVFRVMLDGHMAITIRMRHDEKLTFVPTAARGSILMLLSRYLDPALNQAIRKDDQYCLEQKRNMTSIQAYYSLEIICHDRLGHNFRFGLPYEQTFAGMQAMNTGPGQAGSPADGQQGQQGQGQKGRRGKGNKAAGSSFEVYSTEFQHSGAPHEMNDLTLGNVPAGMTWNLGEQDGFQESRNSEQNNDRAVLRYGDRIGRVEERND